MRKKLFKLVLFLSFLCLPALNFATPELGIIIGDPTGLSFEYNDFQGAVGWNLDKYMHVHLDYLFYKTKPTIVDFYVGLGGVFVAENSDNKDKNDNEHTLGARLPVGISYFVKDVKLRVFLEIVPTMFFVKETDFGFQWGVGVRYVF